MPGTRGRVYSEVFLILTVFTDRMSVMATRARRRVNRPTSAGGRAIRNLVGDSVTAGRPFHSRTRANALPRPNALAILSRLFTAARSRSLAAPGSRVVRRAPPAVYKARRRVERLRLIHPLLSSRTRDCANRSERREVMFARRVAGKKWGSGGPRMKGARRQLSSAFSCRR